jgi:hypothetical protein
MSQCQYVYRSGQLHPSIRIGGASLGQCQNKVCDEALLFCHEHINKDALLLLISMMRKEGSKAGLVQKAEV